MLKGFIVPTIQKRQTMHGDEKLCHGWVSAAPTPSYGCCAYPAAAAAASSHFYIVGLGTLKCQHPQAHARAQIEARHMPCNRPSCNCDRRWVARTRVHLLCVPAPSFSFGTRRLGKSSTGKWPPPQQAPRKGGSSFPYPRNRNHRRGCAQTLDHSLIGRTARGTACVNRHSYPISFEPKIRSRRVLRSSTRPMVAVLLPRASPEDASRRKRKEGAPVRTLAPPTATRNPPRRGARTRAHTKEHANTTKHT